jgi:hypothetical protein
MAQTFAAGYQRPGTYTNVKFEPGAQPITPSFVTALVGRTYSDKPASKDLLRNNAVGYNVTIKSDGSINSGAADAVETTRRDILDVVANVSTSAGLLLVDAIIDGTGTEHLKGTDQSWVMYETSPQPTGNAYVEWGTNYIIGLGTSTTEEYAGSSGSGAAIELARFTEDPIYPTNVQAITAPDDVGTDNLELTVAGGPVYNVQWGAGTPVVLSFSNGYAKTVVTGGGGEGAIVIRADESKMPAYSGAGTDSYKYDVTVYSAGPTAGSSTTGGTYSAASHGTKYTIYYRKPKTSSDFVAGRYDDLSSLQNFHGAITAATGTDYLSFGAVPYFANGGTVVAVPLKDKTITLVATDPDLSTNSGYVEAVRQALILLENEADVSNIIVLSPTETGYRPDISGLVKTHVLNMSSTTARKPRMAILGARANTTLETTFISAAQALKTNRVVYLAPSTVELNAGGYAFIGDGSTLAAAIAGLLSKPTFDAGEPISGKTLDMFSNVPDPFTQTQKNRLALNGVAVIEKYEGATKIMHFLTTDPTSALTAEGVITRIEIDFRRTIQQALDAVLINTRFVEGQTIGTARTIISQICDMKKAAQIFTDYKITKLARNGTDPRQLDVEMAIMPVFPLTWIYINATFTISI